MAHKQYKENKKMGIATFYVDLELYSKIKEHIRLTEVGSMSKYINNIMEDYHNKYMKN